jgi:hypothetical protein
MTARPEPRTQAYTLERVNIQRSCIVEVHDLRCVDCKLEAADITPQHPSPQTPSALI